MKEHEALPEKIKTLQFELDANAERSFPDRIRNSLNGISLTMSIEAAFAQRLNAGGADKKRS